MPTMNPRISLTVSPEFDATVTRLSRLTGQSKSSVLMEVLGPSQPFLDEVANLLEAAGSLKQEPANQLAEKLAKLQERMTSGLGVTPRAAALMMELVREMGGSPEAEAIRQDITDNEVRQKAEDAKALDLLRLMEQRGDQGEPLGPRPVTRGPKSARPLPPPSSLSS